MEPQQIERWLSARRFEPFLGSCEGDHAQALALYDWHGEISAACFELIHHFEVLIRNAIDGVLAQLPSSAVAVAGAAEELAPEVTGNPPLL